MSLSLILRANNGAPLTWDQMDNNLLYLQYIAKAQTLDDVLTNGNTSAQSIVLNDGIQATEVSPGGFVYSDLINNGTLTFVLNDILTTNYRQGFQSKNGTIALLSDVTNSVVGGIATASVLGGSGAQKMEIRHSLGYTPSFALATPINASSSTIPYYVSYTEFSDTRITIRFPNMATTTLMGYSYIVK